MPRRRQNTSCDQCRSGKRRCDVRFRVEDVAGTASSHASQHLPCTNCKRWKKTCTIEWIKSLDKHKQPEPLQGALHDTPLDNFCLNENITSPLWFQDGLTLLASDQQTEMDGFGKLPQFPDVGLQPSFYSDFSSSDAASLHSMNRAASLASFVTGERHPDAEYYPDGSQVQEAAYYAPSIDLPSFESFAGSDYMNKSTQSQDTSWDSENSDNLEALIPGRTASPFTAQLLSEEWNRLSIKKGLLKIYHDSMEGALSCWLTERNCPYSSAAFEGGDVWSSNWGNRIVTRVCELDKAYSTTNSLSVHEQNQASKVLNLVVMAFAAQWSQAGERSNSRLATTGASLDRLASPGYCSSLECAEDDVFGRDMQKTLWHQASRALGEASTNKSFKVIFAGIVFSLSQRPFDINEVLGSRNTNQRNGLDPLLKILDLDGAPISLDIALRKLLDHHRCMLEEGATWLKTSKVNQETFGLLCWLAVMFDTLSAAINRRSFTACDEDSNFNNSMVLSKPSRQRRDPFVDLDVWSEPFEEDCTHDTADDIWGDYFLQQKSYAGDLRKQNIRWPCSYQDAASCLTDAAPVKVLLFRRVGHLQNLSYRRTSGIEIEKAVEAVIRVYTHWNDTYGQFIEDCIQYHEQLPARIQSWYILLAGHWNLAVLILADVLQKLDDMHLSTPEGRHRREAVGFTNILRTRAAFVISNIGRCSQYGDQDLTFSQSPDFHHAVNKAALLTEPWTTVLVRAFGYAGKFLASQVLSHLGSSSTMEMCGMRQRLQYCIDALWLLGKKSDMALCAAQFLLQAVA